MTVTPLTMTSPSVGSRKPAIRFKIVLLPHPEGPMMVMNSPRLGTSSMLNDNSVTAVKEPNLTVTLRNSIMGAVLEMA